MFNKPSDVPLHIVFCIVDHFEPFWGKVGREKAFRRVETWIRKYPEIADRHTDSMGRQPKYTFFYPEEEYDPWLLDMLADLCRRGYGEVEIHLHHDNDTPEDLREKLLRFKEVLAKRHSLLSTDKDSGEIRYGFIHGNWALCNSRKDGKWCGVNNELPILRETGCYADFTLPSAPSDTQTRKINGIYYVKDNPGKSKSHDTGIDIEVGKSPEGDLLIIQGPLTLNWKNRKWGILPRIENGSITAENPVNIARIDLWVKCGATVLGRPDWVFIKVYTHGCQEKNMTYLFSQGLETLFSSLEIGYNNGVRYTLNYVSAREMFNIIKALEEGEKNFQKRFLDYQLVFNRVRNKYA